MASSRRRCGALLLSTGPIDRKAASLRLATDGETAAAFFALFEAKKALPKVVIATKQTTETVMHLRAAYDAMVVSLLIPCR